MHDINRQIFHPHDLSDLQFLFMWFQITAWHPLDEQYSGLAGTEIIGFTDYIAFQIKCYDSFSIRNTRCELICEIALGTVAEVCMSCTLALISLHCQNLAFSKSIKAGVRPQRMITTNFALANSKLRKKFKDRFQGLSNFLWSRQEFFIIIKYIYDWTGCPRGQWNTMGKYSLISQRDEQICNGNLSHARLGR